MHLLFGTALAGIKGEDARHRPAGDRKSSPAPAPSHNPAMVLNQKGTFSSPISSRASLIMIWLQQNPCVASRMIWRAVSSMTFTFFSDKHMYPIGAAKRAQEVCRAACAP